MRVLDLLLEMRADAQAHGGGGRRVRRHRRPGHHRGPGRGDRRRARGRARPRRPAAAGRERRTASIDADGRVYLEELEEKLGLAAADGRGPRRGRHAGRADLHPGRPRADPGRDRDPSERPRVRGAGRRPAPHQAGADPAPGRRRRPKPDAAEPPAARQPHASHGSSATPTLAGVRSRAWRLAAALPPLYCLPALLGLRRARGACCGRPPGPGRRSCAAPRSASASSWPASTGSASPSSPTPSGSALYAVPAVLGWPRPGPHGRPRRGPGRPAALAPRRGAGAGLRRRLDHRRAVARRPRAAVPLEPGRVGLGRSATPRCRPWPAPAPMASASLTVAAAGTAGTPVPAAGRRRAARGVAAPALLACSCSAPGRWRLARGAGAAGHRRPAAHRPGQHRAAPQMGSRAAAAVVPPPSRAVGARPHDPPPQVVIWPERRCPTTSRREPEVRELPGRGRRPPGGVLLVGGDRYELDREPPIAAQQPVRARSTVPACCGPLRQGRSGAVRRVPAVPRRARPARACAS